MVDFKLYNHLGFHNPYYIKEEGKIIIEESLSSIMKYSDNHELDFSAIVQILNYGFSLGDRTIIKGIQKTPWMAKPNDELTDWDYFNVPQHSEKIDSEFNISNKLYLLLKEELYNYVHEYSKIGILLTGGMDSRIVACILNEMIVSEELENKSVIAFTWGRKNSRDVAYASQIAKLFKWDWEHLIVDKEQIVTNLGLSIENGCEFSPIHYHAMSKVASTHDIDCLLAGSFGDSIGRGEYSKVKVKNLTSLGSQIKDFGGLLRKDFKELVEEDFKSDINKYHNLFPQEKLYQSYEQDQQLHYMRRMLNPCMAIINKAKPLFQMFSSPKVFGYMWSLHPDLRGNNIYRLILELNNNSLLQIPWARTGLEYPLITGQPDSYLKNHHDYGQLIREEFLNMVENKLNTNYLNSMNLFNIEAINCLINYCRKKPIHSSLFYEEKLLWLSCIGDFLHKNRINSSLLPEQGSSKSLFSTKLEYNRRYYYTKIRKFY